MERTTSIKSIPKAIVTYWCGPSIYNGTHEIGRFCSQMRISKRKTSLARKEYLGDNIWGCDYRSNGKNIPKSSMNLYEGVL